MWARGLQFSKLDEILTEIDRYLQKITFYLLQNVQKCFIFWAYTFKICKKVGTDKTEKFFSWKCQYGVSKNINYADPKFSEMGLKNVFSFFDTPY